MRALARFTRTETSFMRSWLRVYPRLLGQGPWPSGRNSEEPGSATPAVRTPHQKHPNLTTRHGMFGWCIMSKTPLAIGWAEDAPWRLAVSWEDGNSMTRWMRHSPGAALDLGRLYIATWHIGTERDYRRPDLQSPISMQDLEGTVMTQWLYQ